MRTWRMMGVYGLPTLGARSVHPPLAGSPGGAPTGLRHWVATVGVFDQTLLPSMYSTWRSSIPRATICQVEGGALVKPGSPGSATTPPVLAKRPVVLLQRHGVFGSLRSAGFGAIL